MTAGVCRTSRTRESKISRRTTKLGGKILERNSCFIVSLRPEKGCCEEAEFPIESPERMGENCAAKTAAMRKTASNALCDWLRRLDARVAAMTAFWDARRLLARPFTGTVRGRRLDRQEIGRLGEDIAAVWLRRRRRMILQRNFSGLHDGEVDIVCRHDDVLVFAEVKTRTSDGFGRPADAVTADKQRLIQRGANEWMRLLGRPKIKFRFDIIEVLLIAGERPNVNVIENAFQMPEQSLAGR